MIKELTISVDGTKVVGMLDAAPDSVTVQIEAPCRNLKASAHFSSYGMGYHRFVVQGKLTQAAIQNGKEILKELFLAGQYLHEHPEFIKRIRRYLARFEKQAAAIQQSKKDLRHQISTVEMSKKDYEARAHELQLAERQNVIERGNLFRQYAGELSRESGGRADIKSILEFEPAQLALSAQQQSSE